MIDSKLHNDENIMSLARKVKDIDEVLRVTWQNILSKKYKEKYGENGICMFITMYAKDNTEEVNTFANFLLFVSEAVYSNPEKHHIPIDGFKTQIDEYFQSNEPS
jgi:hypothetical protein